MSDEKESKHGVQSLEVGAGVLRAVVNGHRAMMLKEIAAAADIPPSKAHRYLVSLIRSGLIEQDPATSRYSLGPFALNIGLVAIDRLDRIRLGMAAISELRDEINETTAIAVWGDHGPVIVRWERPQRPITVLLLRGCPQPRPKPRLPKNCVTSPQCPASRPVPKWMPCWRGYARTELHR